MAAIDIPALALRLNDGQVPRVWSLLVTVFGDLAQDDDAVIAASDLRRVMSVIGIKPETMRVALHRLRNEGWIESTKTGRTSAYRLSPLGRRESQSASPRIYGDNAPLAQTCLVVHASDARPMDGQRVAPHLTLATTAHDDPTSISFPIDEETDLPIWLRDLVCSHSLVMQSQVLAAAIHDCITCQGDIKEMPDDTQLALRIVLLHGWRRIVLKAPLLPDYMFPEGWQGELCRTSLRRILDDLSSASLG